MGNGTKHNTVININGGELTGTDGYAIYHPQSGELNITGGRLTGGETGIEIRAGKLNLSGDAVITAKGIPTTTTPNGSGTTTVGAGIAVTQLLPSSLLRSISPAEPFPAIPRCTKATPRKMMTML